MDNETLFQMAATLTAAKLTARATKTTPLPGMPFQGVALDFAASYNELLAGLAILKNQNSTANLANFEKLGGG